MNKKQIVASLNKIANELDNSGLHKEANSVTNVMEKLAQMQMPVAPISKPNQDTYGYQAAVDKWIATNQQAVNNALQSPMPMQALAPLLMNVQPVELANAIRVKIGQMKQGLA
jgi:hypothetical protein